MRDSHEQETTPMLAILGPVEPVLRHALLDGCGPELQFRFSGSQGRALIEEGRALRAAAIITRREEIVDLCGELPGDILVFGVARGSWTVLVCSGAEMSQLTNPPPGQLTRMIRTWLRTGVLDSGSQEN